MTNIEAMKLALEALEAFLRFAAIHHDGPDTSDKYLAEDYAVEGFRKARQVLPALRTAIETAEKQEPVAWANINKHGDITHTNNKRMPWSKTPLYTTPPAQPAKQKPVAWIGLEPSDMPDGDDPMYDHDFFLKGMAWADAILRKKNTTPPTAQPCPYIRSTAEGTHHCALSQRQPLTDEAIWRQYQALWPFHPAEEPRLAADMVTFARAIEAAHGIKEKNT